MVTFYRIGMCIYMCACICIISYLQFHIVKDWELYQQLIDHLYKRHIKTDSELHPVLMSEPTVSVT